jgi:hypothetical protein
MNNDKLNIKELTANISLNGVMKSCGLNQRIRDRVRYRINKDNREKYLIGLGKSHLLKLASEFLKVSEQAKKMSDYFLSLANEKTADHV